MPEAQAKSNLPVLIGAALMLSLSMGIRQSFGLVMQPMTRDIAVTVSDFTLAMAVQNLVLGFLQPVVGALAVRWGFRPLLVGGAVLYLGGLALFASAQGFTALMIGAGFMIGTAMACTAQGMALPVGAQAVSAGRRSLALGVITGAGSLGALLSAPLAQSLSVAHGWRAGVLGFLVLALGLLPAAWLAGGVDRLPPPPRPANQTDEAATYGAALGTALRNPSFVVMACCYFVCGMQLLFIATHLPAYLAICGQDPMLGAQALGAIGVFNVLGSVFFGWAGGRWNKLVLLGLIYLARSAVFVLYFVLPPTPASTLAFASAMGFLWLGVGPLVAGAVAEMFGLRWQAMIQGLATMTHQVGSFVGAFGGGVLYDALGSYDLAWRIAVATGLVAGAVQVIFALLRPTGPGARRCGEAASWSPSPHRA